MKLGGHEVLEGWVVKRKARTVCFRTLHCMVNGEVRHFLPGLKADQKWILGDQVLA